MVRTTIILLFTYPANGTHWSTSCISEPDKNLHLVVDCGLAVMKEHCYWPLVSDLNNVLSHRSVALKFMGDDSLLEIWFDFLKMFQGECLTSPFPLPHSPPPPLFFLKT